MNKRSDRYTTGGRLYRRGLVFSLLLVVTLLSLSASPGMGTPIGDPDNPRRQPGWPDIPATRFAQAFLSMGSRTLRLDSNGYPHFALWSDKLYYATNLSHQLAGAS